MENPGAGSRAPDWPETRQFAKELGFSVFTEKDHLEVLSLYGRVNQAWDDGDVDVFVACFTENGRYERPYVGLITEGRAELTELARKQAASLTTTLRKKHLALNILINGSGDTATGSCDHLVIAADAKSPPHCHSLGRCDDNFVRTAGGWRIAVRVKRHEFIE